MKDTVPILGITTKRGGEAAPIRGIYSPRSWKEQIIVLITIHDAVSYYSGGIRFEYRTSSNLTRPKFLACRTV
jgi:hypothetical protein